MAASSVVKVISHRRRNKIESCFKYGVLGRYLIRSYFNSYKDIAVIGSDTNSWVYSAWLSYLKENSCFQKEYNPLGKSLAGLMEFVDLYLPFEEMSAVLQKLKGLGREDPTYMEYLSNYYKSIGKDDYASEVSYTEDYYSEFIDSFRELVENSFKNRQTIVIWTPV